VYLSDRDLKWAIDCGRLKVNPKPTKIDPTSIDLHLDSVSEARIWNIRAFHDDARIRGDPPGELRIGKFDYRKFSPEYLIPPPTDTSGLVFQRGHEIVVKPNGFILWQTKETVGTPEEGAGLICFIDGKSTKARTGLLVHLTAPNIHATWSGKITLEIANLGPFSFVLEEDDVIAAITVAMVSSIPERSMQEAGSVTYSQTNVSAST
jgi:dCTP deaminase